MSVKYNNETIAGKYKTQIIDTSKFATKDEVNDLLEEKANTSDIPDVTNFITMADVEEKGYLTEVPSEYITQIELDDKGYASLVDIQGKADASTVNEQLELKADKSTTYTKSEVDDKIADAVTGGQIDLSGYAKDGEVVHLANSETITGSKTFTQPLKIQNGAGTGSLLIGGDVNAGTVTNGARKLARIAVPTQANKDLTSILLGFDSNGDDALNITNRGSDNIAFGGSKKITNATSPMSISFCVAKERNATDASKKTYALEMDANEARFNSRPNYNGVNLATTVDVTNALSDYAKLTDIPDVSNYITMDDVEAKGYLTEVPSEYITETELNNKGYLTEIPEEYITETELNNKGYLTEHQDISNLATKTELTEGLETKQPTGNYALKSDIPDVSNLATKSELTSKQNTLVDSSTIDVDGSSLKVIGVQSKSGDVLYDWIGTEDEYNAGISNGLIDSNWLCYITDDESELINNIPVATTTKTGLVRPDGSTITINNGVISAVNSGNSYTLPTASTTTLGGVKIDGSTITINNGVISSKQYSLPVATNATLGGVKVDNSTVKINNQVISVNGVNTVDNTLLKFKKLTQNDYDALITKDENTLYIITG